LELQTTEEEARRDVVIRWSVVAAAALALVPVSRAELIRFTFEGEVVTVVGSAGIASTISTGDAFSFTYLFDSTLFDSDPDPQMGMYESALLSPEAMIGSSMLDSWESTRIMVLNDMDGDMYAAELRNGSGQMLVLEAYDGSQTAFASDLLPTSLDLGAFEGIAAFLVIPGSGEGSESAFIQAHITTFSAMVVPIPGAVWLGVAGLGLVVWGRRWLGSV
jgi:hypothetical protein